MSRAFMEAGLNSQPGSSADRKANLKLVAGVDVAVDGSSPEVEQDFDLGASSNKHTKPIIDLSGLTDDQKPSVVLDIVREELADNKAEDVVTINLEGKTSIADTMVIASGRSQRHVGSVADKVLRRLKECGLKSISCEGQPACDWVLIDAGDVILHLFRPEVRSFYNLERIWSETAHATGVDSQPN
ncbi:MAG: ribosome silencing factor [Pseudomonadota bacterium]